MKTLKKIMALLLAVLMVTAMFAGCAKNPSADTTTKGNDAADTTTKGNDAADTTAAVDEEPVKLKFMINLGDWPEDSIGGEWERKVEEACNVDIEWVLPASSAYEDSLQLMLLDDEKPDAVLFPDAWRSQASFIDACKNGIIMNLKDMVGNYPNIMEYTAPISWVALDVVGDGGIYGVPRSTMIRADGFLFIEQWIDALGIDYTEGDYLTIDEFYDILYKFTFDDPDGNGIDDTFGIKAYANSDGSLNTGIERFFGIGDGWVYEEESGLYMAPKFSKANDTYKRYLTYMNKLWSTGVIDPDAFSMDGTAANDRQNMNMYGCYAEFAGWCDVKADDADGRTTIILPGVVENKGDPYGYGNFSTGIWYQWCIMNTCERPDKVMDVFEYLLSDEGWEMAVAAGVEGYNYTKTADGEYDYSLQDTLTDEQKNVGLTKSIVRRSTGADFFVSRAYDADTRARLEKYINEAVNNAVISADRGYVPEIAKDSAFIEYQAWMIDEINKIIVGEKPIDYYDELLDGWYEVGGQSYVDDMNAYINSLEG